MGLFIEFIYKKCRVMPEAKLRLNHDNHVE